ncbi:hypothetical protein SESBI_04237 [Sesbania bispinosa]|nr:hypothetical protein SESBI_04237 [Sesbania bispinosa]
MLCHSCAGYRKKKSGREGWQRRVWEERETETLNHARQLVFRNDQNLVAQAPPHLGCCQPIAAGGYHSSGNMGDPTVPLRFPRYFSASSSTHVPPPPAQPYLYSSPSRPVSFPSHFPQHQVNDYHVGHVMSSSQAYNMSYGGGGGDSSSYTCVGAPVGQGLLRSMDAGGKDGSLQNQEEGLNWGRSYSGAGGTAQHRLGSSFSDQSVSRWFLMRFFE